MKEHGNIFSNDKMHVSPSAKTRDGLIFTIQ